MANTSPAPIDPTKEYSEADLAAMQQVLAANQAKKDAALADQRQRYKVKVDAFVATPEYLAVKAALDALASDADRDDILSFYVDPARLNLARLAGN